MWRASCDEAVAERGFELLYLQRVHTRGVPSERDLDLGVWPGEGWCRTGGEGGTSIGGGGGAGRGRSLGQRPRLQGAPRANVMPLCARVF